MILGIAEDYTNVEVLDKELTSIPQSGLYINGGSHPLITINNLLQFLPNLDMIFNDWNIAKNYNIYSESRNIDDIVMYDNKLYQSLIANVGKQPDIEATYWIETNVNSLRLKSFIFNVIDKVISDLKLTKSLVNNQYIYEVGEDTITLPNDYAGWVFEPKGSDYTSIRINEISFQKESITPVNLYVINQGVLVTTLQITPSNGIVEFKKLDYTFKGKGRWIFAIDSTDVKVNNYNIDPLKYKGFVAYTASGIGVTPNGAQYSYNTSGNGLGFNISVFLDSSSYILNNLSDFGSFIKATFEYMAFQMFLYNSNNQINSSQRTIANIDLLSAEVMNTKADTSVTRYLREKSIALKKVSKTFDSSVTSSDYSAKIGTF